MDGTDLEFRDEEGELNLSPDDGYSAILASGATKGTAMLTVEFRVNNHSMLTADGSGIVLREYEGKDLFAVGESNREVLLVQSICRYLTTGGTWEQFQKLTNDMAGIAKFPLELPEGYRLVDTYLTDDGYYEHEFARDADDKVLRWAEGIFVEETDMPSLLENWKAELADEG